MDVYIPTKAERDQFRAKAQAPVVEWLRKEVGNEWVDGMFAAAAAAK
jgi:hypothetical protein